MDDFDDERHCVPPKSKTRKTIMISYRFYLSEKGEQKVQDHTAFKKYDGVYAKRDPRGQYVDISLGLTSDNPIPEEDYTGVTAVDEHTFTHTSTGTRSTGVYKFRTASLTLEVVAAVSTGGAHSIISHYRQSFFCEGSKFEDVKELMSRVRAGTIRPIPGLNFDAKQVPPLPTQFRDWIMMGWRLMQRDLFRCKGVY